MKQRWKGNVITERVKTPKNILQSKSNFERVMKCSLSSREPAGPLSYQLMPSNQLYFAHLREVLFLYFNPNKFLIQLNRNSNKLKLTPTTQAKVSI